MSDRFDALTTQLAELNEQTHARDRASRHATMRAEVLARAHGRRSSTLARWSIPAAALAMIAAAVVLVLGLGRTRALSFRIDAETRDVDAQAFVIAEDEPRTMTFSDGSTIEVRPHSRVRVGARRSDGVDLVLERGSITTRFAGDAAGSWHIDAGPYHVVALGAALELRWSPDDGAFELLADDGRVEVHGLGIEGTRVLDAGERLAITPPPPTVAPEEIAIVDDAPAEAAPAPTRTRRSTRARAEDSAPAVDWRAHARAGRWDEAMADARARGFTRLCATLDAEGLLQLADVGRYSGQKARAREALAALRRRFPASDAAATAAFDLGRLASGDPASCDEAVEWFETYVRERPRGTMAEAARKRIAECTGR